MILVTVGTQAGFDRLVEGADRVLCEMGRDCLFQIDSGAYLPRAGRSVRRMSGDEFRHAISSADIVISHAGMGVILTALEMRKRVIVVPRRAALKEHRNDHQIDTAARLEALGLVTVCWDMADLIEKLKAATDSSGTASVGASNLDELRAFVHKYISMQFI